VVVLGSALGAAAVWPALAFGFAAVGFDALHCAVDGAEGLLRGLKGDHGKATRARVVFRQVTKKKEETKSPMPKSGGSFRFCWRVLCSRAFGRE